MLDETLVVWDGEFGRTPTAEGTDGREHHPFGFTMFLAGGCIRRGLAYGATDEFGCHGIEDRVHVHDLHATTMHLMGIDHEQLTYRYSGRDFRLTDVHGRVVREMVACPAGARADRPAAFRRPPQIPPACPLSPARDSL